jgi:glycosyltransferase involved in cell wall biosynthesis
MRMIFHHPLPIRAGAPAASAIRPWRMVEAFQSLGFEVDLVCGYSSDRARAIADVESKLARGLRYAFMYGESSTEPTLLTDRHHLPVRPLQDFRFLARLKAASIPLGLFYRDIYWRFPGYGVNLPAWKRVGARLCYRYDLWQYRRLIDRLYLPSMAMAAHVPRIDPARTAALPPGCVDGVPPRRASSRLRLLYVGGLGDHYRLHALIEALHGLPQVELVLCTRETEWLAVRHEYSLPPAGNVKVVHRSGDELTELFEQSDVGVLCVEPQSYREFAAPLKLYEYLGAERAVLASAGTLAAEFVSTHGIGWVVPYDAHHIAGHLRELLADRSLLEDKFRAAQRIKSQHTWAARARQVAADLAGWS